LKVYRRRPTDDVPRAQEVWDWFGQRYGKAVRLLKYANKIWYVTFRDGTCSSADTRDIDFDRLLEKVI